ncbi:hypothetical protein THAOC_16249 [Thalassiosira oceanica]|uniref:Uncharacterized protein n=1 Tax=Thalassiosira oceanica TaxID=159749 RepID=K0SDR9_THAOC|nr:hypothetical protein THAOC_16249 [Thalassiosira oceanica]|eukprot:EJK63114.1 hypothetical protein THAOC_16249 [Thalassiosira oceanica]
MPMQPMPTIIGYGLPDSGASTLIVVKRLHSIIREQTGIARQPTQAQLNLNAKRMRKVKYKGGAAVVVGVRTGTMPADDEEDEDEEDVPSNVHDNRPPSSTLSVEPQNIDTSFRAPGAGAPSRATRQAQAAAGYGKNSSPPTELENIEEAAFVCDIVESVRTRRHRSTCPAEHCSYCDICDRLEPRPETSSPRVVADRKDVGPDKPKLS